jgi:hypothetical protein
MKNKTSLNNMQEFKPDNSAKLEIEKKLLPRLQFMGYVMFTCCAASIAYAIFAPREPEIDFKEQNYMTVHAAGLQLAGDEDPLELSPTEVLNFYVVGLIFASVGASCLLAAWKKKKHLFH